MYFPKHFKYNKAHKGPLPKGISVKSNQLAFGSFGLKTLEEGKITPLLKAKQRKAGHCNSGRITVRHRQLFTKKRYRKVDFRQELFENNAKIIEIIKDPFRTAHVELIG